MSYLVVYMSQHGTTQKLATYLSQELDDKVRLVNLANEAMPDIESWSTVIIGGSIHMGQIQKKIRQFCELNEKQLLLKRLGLFLCFMNTEEGAVEFDTAFPVSLRTHAVAHGLFGGELLLEKMNFLERLMVKAVRGVKESVSVVDEDAVEEFLRLIRE